MTYFVIDMKPSKLLINSVKKSFYSLLIASLTLSSAFAQEPEPTPTAPEPQAAPLVTLQKENDTRKIEVELLKVEDGAVEFRREDGKKFTMALLTLSKSCREEIMAAWEEKNESVSEGMDSVNEAFGYPIISKKGSIWNEPMADVAKRLKLPLESKTPYTSSYRLYPRAKYVIAGVAPKTLVAYGDDQGNTESISIIYSNKGDSLSTVGSGKEHFKESGEKIDRRTLKGLMEYDTVIIAKTLTKALGEPVKQRMLGQGNKSHAVDRWDWNGHSFILAHVKEEYVRLSVVSTDFADGGGKTSRISDGEMKVRLQGMVAHEENGDVYVKDIPMVDQGPKGYCAPATFERAMRHAGVAADMYLLATLATTGGGGTNTEKLYAEVSFTTRSKGGRTAKEISLKSLAPSKLKRYIEKGVPVLWQMCSLPGYNKIANQRTAERENVKDWTAYAAKIEEEAKSNVETLTAKGNYHHICMIIGYNETTNEIAVSDSWGTRYTIRWIHLDEAEAVSNQNGFVIDI